MPTIGGLFESAALASALVFCIAASGALLFWVAGALERDLNKPR
jgi:hypothetical protein